MVCQMIKSQILQGVYSFCGNGVSYGGKLVSEVDSCINKELYMRDEQINRFPIEDYVENRDREEWLFRIVDKASKVSKIIGYRCKALMVTLVMAIIMGTGFGFGQSVGAVDMYFYSDYSSNYFLDTDSVINTTPVSFRCTFKAVTKSGKVYPFTYEFTDRGSYWDYRLNQFGKWEPVGDSWFAPHLFDAAYPYRHA